MVDELVGQWRRVRPDLDLRAMGTIARLGRLALVVGARVDAVLADFGLSRGDFDVLATLRRADKPCSPTSLVQALMVSPSGMTGRLDRLEEAGHVRRKADPTDRRALLVELTDDGLALVDEAVTAHDANEEHLLSGITDEQRARLDEIAVDLLASLTVRDEPPSGRQSGH